MIEFILMLVATILFILAAAGASSGRVNLIGAGLAFMAAAFALQLYPG